MKGSRFTITALSLALLVYAVEALPPASEPSGYQTSPPPPASGSLITPGAPARNGCPRRWVRAARSSTWMATAGWTFVLINGKDLIPRGRHTTAAFYRNNHNGTFTDITRGSGLDIDIYGMGVAVGDYDNDGREDVYITALGGDHLFHNEGNGHFRDVTQRCGHCQCGLRLQRGVVGLRSRRQTRSHSSRTMCNGALQGTSGARSMALQNRIARRNRTKVRRRNSIAISATASSRTSPKRRALEIPQASR